MHFKDSMRRFGGRLAVAAWLVLPTLASAVVLPGAYCSEVGSGTSCDIASATVSSRPAVGSFGYSTLTYYLYIASDSVSSVPVHVQAALLASERFEGSNVPYFWGDYPKYDVFSWFNLGTSGFYNGNPGLVFAGIGARSTRSGLDGSDVGGQFGYSQTISTSLQVSADGLQATQTAWLNLDTQVTLSTNQLYVVQIGANVGGGYNSPPQLVSFPYAYADPFFEIDPGFLALNPAAASLSLSNGVANAPVAQVPEPGSLLLMLGGTALLAFRRRS